jgi:hypothetical protein
MRTRRNWLRLTPSSTGRSHHVEADSVCSLTRLASSGLADSPTPLNLRAYRSIRSTPQFRWRRASMRPSCSGSISEHRNILGSVRTLPLIVLPRDLSGEVCDDRGGGMTLPCASSRQPFTRHLVTGASHCIARYCRTNFAIRSIVKILRLNIVTASQVSLTGDDICFVNNGRVS